MKKLCLAILAILYLTTSMGATIHFHYCMGKFIDWELGCKTGSICTNCGMQKSDKPDDNGCCRDEFKQIKTEKDQRVSENFVSLNETVTEINFSFQDYSVSQLFFLPLNFDKINSPPRSWNSSINILNCVFRI